MVRPCSYLALLLLGLHLQLVNRTSVGELTAAVVAAVLAVVGGERLPRQLQIQKRTGEQP